MDLGLDNLLNPDTLETCQAFSNADMDSLTFYDFESSTKAAPNKTVGGQDRTLTIESGGYLSDLDPNAELSLDLEALLRGSSTGTPTGNPEQLFPDLITIKSEKNDLDTPEIHVKDSHMPHFLTEQTPTTVTQIIQDPAPAEEHNTPSLPKELQAAQVVTLSLPGQDSGTLLQIPVSMLPADLNLLPVKTEQVGGAAQATICEVSSTVDKTPLQLTSSEVKVRNSFKAPTPSSSKRPSTGRRRALDKCSVEYKERRARNNVAVRKSRDKAKEKQQATEHRVQELSDKNDQLQKKVDLMSKELNVLRGLFQNIGAKLPPQYHQFMQKA